MDQKDLEKIVGETAIVFLIACVQFVNTLDFMMVMPMGPDFASALAIPMDRLGLIGGSYTAAACIAGIASSFFLDRFDRKRALVISLVGLSLATAAGALATGLPTLLLARIAAGMFGGPTSSLSLSIIADVIPPARRGKAMGTVMSSFAMASILGVPAGLELARLGGWQTPFIAVGTLAALAALAAYGLLPIMRDHLKVRTKAEQSTDISWTKAFRSRKYVYSFILISIGTFCTFLIVPNLSAYVQFNLGWPRSRMGLLYLIGGVLSLVANKFVGTLIDRRGVMPSITGSTALIILVMVFGFFDEHFRLPVLLFFPCYMLANSTRFLTISTLTSKVPTLYLRARFMSVQSAILHLTSALGAFLSTVLLSSNSDGRLSGMTRLAVSVALLSLIIPLMAFRLQKFVMRDQKAQG